MKQQIYLDGHDLTKIVADHVTSGLPEGASVIVNVHFWGTQETKSLSRLSKSRATTERLKSYAQQRQQQTTLDDRLLTDVGAIVTVRPAPVPAEANATQ